MEKLRLADLMTLEDYHRERDGFRAKVLAHKRHRQVGIGPNVMLTFEDRLTMQYQVQEMLRIERIFEREAIEEELESYNPLIPDGTNFKATMMIEFPDTSERRLALQQLVGIEDRVFVEVRGERVYAIADEDMERSEESKTAAVHFLRFELAPAMVDALKQGADLAVGVAHPRYEFAVDAVPAEVHAALIADLR
jgi:hypothetical protein